MVALFVLLTFVLFVVIDIFVLKAQKKHHPAFAPKFQIADLSVFTRKDIAVPEGIFISKGHTWAAKNEYGLIKIGVDQFIQKVLGSCNIRPLVAADTKVSIGDKLFEIPYKNKSLTFRSPITGTVKFLNPNVNYKTEKIYNGDWAVILSPEYFDKEKDLLFSGKKLTSWLNKEMDRFKDFLSDHTAEEKLAGATMYDGGMIAEGALNMLTAESLTDFENNFLKI